MKYYTTYDSPIGILKIIEDGKNIIGIEFGDNQYDKTNTVLKSTPLLKEAALQLSEYFSGKRKKFTIPLFLEGTEFQIKVWNSLLKIPYGETRSYKDIAKEAGCPQGARAIGLANNRNHIPIIIPCHRVIGTNGSLTGYAGGLDIKRKLLEIENII
jgi:methylated-DNA-[protein]-cysteine S-methyltransferase